MDVLRSFNRFKYNYETVDIWLWPVGEKSIKAFKWGPLLSIESFLLIVCKNENCTNDGSRKSLLVVVKRGYAEAQLCQRPIVEKQFAEL